MALPLIAALAAAGADVAAYDPLLDDAEMRGARRPALALGRAGPVPGDRHADGRPRVRDRSTRPGSRSSRVVYDGRNSLRALALPDGVAYVGVGVQAATRAGPGAA